jgi:hypothetical protein
MDDARHDRALDLLVTDCATRLQVVLLTAQGVRSKWFLHQFPEIRARVASIYETTADEEAVETESEPSGSSSFSR